MMRNAKLSGVSRDPERIILSTFATKASHRLSFRFPVLEERKTLSYMERDKHIICFHKL